MIKKTRPHVPHPSSSAGRTSWKPWERPQPKPTSPVRPSKKRKQSHRHHSPPSESISFEDHLVSLLSCDAELLSCVRSHIYLLANPSPSSSTSDPERTSKYAPVRRRRVPANAETWDIPFPFPPGCAPVGYMEKWYAGRTKSLSDEMASLIRRAIITAERTRLKSIETDPLAGWDEGPTSDRARVVGVAPMILEWLERTHQVQACEMGVDLSNLPPTPTTLTGWPASNTALRPFTAEQLTTILEQSIAFAQHKPPPSALDTSDTFSNGQVNVELPQFDFSVLDDLLIPDLAIDPVLLPPPSPISSASACTPDLAVTEPNPTIDFAALDKFFAMFDGDIPSPTSSSVSLPQSQVSSHPPLSGGTQRKRGTVGVGVGKTTIITGRGVGGSGSGNMKSMSEVRTRAQTARDKLQQEYDAVEKQLWACTVEEGVLINLVKVLSKNR